MKIQLVKLVYFSPTGTTETIIRCIAHAMNHQFSLEFIDITHPEARKQPLQTSEAELLVVAVPVYMGRVPALQNEWFMAISAHRTPAVCVVFYGNRAYEDALLELRQGPHIEQNNSLSGLCPILLTNPNNQKKWESQLTTWPWVLRS